MKEKIREIFSIRNDIADYDEIKERIANIKQRNWYKSMYLDVSNFNCFYWSKYEFHSCDYWCNAYFSNNGDYPSYGLWCGGQ